MKKSILLVGLSLAFVTLSHAQIKSMVKSKLKEKVQNSNGNSNNGSLPISATKKSSTFTVEEIDANPYVDYDRVVVTENTPIIFKGVYQYSFKDDIDFSGFYYLNAMAIVSPPNHFSSDTTKAYAGFSINYSQEKHTMQVYWEETDSNYAMVPERYHSSADKGNVMFQMGMTGGPESYFNAECLLLEPGVILVGASVYHKNDEEGHAWMNNITPDFFVIAAKDTAKFKEYQSNPEYTSKVVFEKYDALRAAWKNQEIKDAKPLPQEGMKDVNLKADALALIKKTAAGYKWKEEVQYAYINSTDWEIKRHPITGVPIKRIVKAIVVMKTPQGNYKREGFYIAQDYDGTGSYSQTYMLYNDQRIYYVNPKDAFKYQ
jgi:hypothetical protein